MCWHSGFVSQWLVFSEFSHFRCECSMFKIECDVEDKIWGGERKGEFLLRTRKGFPSVPTRDWTLSSCKHVSFLGVCGAGERTQDFAYARRVMLYAWATQFLQPYYHCYPLRRDVVCVGLIARFYFDLRCCVLSKLFSHSLPFWLLVSLCWAKRVHQACSPVQFHRAFSAGLATIAISKMRHKWVFV